MAVHAAGALRYVTLDSFERYGVVHGIFTRHGGVSPQPWASLNLGGLVGDSRENVIENRARMFAALGRSVESGYDSWLVHGTDSIIVEQPRPLDQAHSKADIILTDRPEITLLMRFADCTPVLLYDPVRRVVGLAHAGWRGTVERVAALAVQRMAEQYGSRPADILAGIGPAISVDNYEVGVHGEVAQRAKQCFGERHGEVLARRNGTAHFDLWRANQIALQECGVRQIELSGICTFEQNVDWFSHRAEQGKTGRFGLLLALPPG